MPDGIAEIDVMYLALAILRDKGVRYGSVIDLGAADGSFCLQYHAAGLLPGAIPIMVDANPIYEESLAAIARALDGHYYIGAIGAEAETKAVITKGAHPYWDSLLPAEDRYWRQINGLAAGTAIVPATTLDALIDRLRPPPPFLLKLDLQGGEMGALEGARRVLAETDVAVIECDVQEFRAIDRVMERAGLDLFDLAQMCRSGDAALAWFYPIYLNRRLAHLRQESLWHPRFDAQMIAQQNERRRGILARNAEILAQLAAEAR